MGEFIPRFEQRDNDARSFGHTRLGTGGAIPIRNEKGQIIMQKVKVQRYMAGKMPAFAREVESDESEYEEEQESTSKQAERRERREERRRESRFDKGPGAERERVVEQPEIIHKDDSDEDELDREIRRAKARERRLRMEEEEEEEYESEPSDEEEVDRRRRMLKEKMLRKEAEELKKESELKMEQAEEELEESEEEMSSSSEEEEEEEDILPRLKPVFVRKKDRVTLIEADKEKKRLEQLKLEEQKKAEDRKRESARLLEEINRKEEEAARRTKEDNAFLSSVQTDDENEEIAYEEWKLREMKRLKRNRDEREAAAREKAELERVHGMTEEERRAYMRANPKLITNKAEKGKYKFLQKYYHRGAYYLHEEDDVYKRNFAEATLEDRFDKTVLPKVMQVKDFGKASRSKWTHLTAEDTTDHQGAWASSTALNINFTNKHGAGMKLQFERPSAKRRKES